MIEQVKEALEYVNKHLYFNTDKYCYGLSCGFDPSKLEAAIEALSQQGEPNAHVPDVDWLSNVIREVDGNSKLGAGALAEKIVEAMRAIQYQQAGKQDQTVETQLINHLRDRVEHRSMPKLDDIDAANLLTMLSHPVASNEPVAGERDDTERLAEGSSRNFTPSAPTCQHNYHYFGDQVKSRRCVKCNKIEEPISQPARPVSTDGYSLSRNHDGDDLLLEDGKVIERVSELVKAYKARFGSQEDVRKEAFLAALRAALVDAADGYACSVAVGAVFDDAIRSLQAQGEKK